MVQLSLIGKASLKRWYLVWILTCVCAKSLQSCPTLCHPMDCGPPGSSVHWILQTRILEWVAMPSSRGSSWPRDQTHVSYISCIGRWVLYHRRHLGSHSEHRSVNWTIDPLPGWTQAMTNLGPISRQSLSNFSSAVIVHISATLSTLNTSQFTEFWNAVGVKPEIMCMLKIVIQLLMNSISCLH